MARWFPTETFGRDDVAVMQFRQGSMLGALFARRAKKAASGPSAARKLLLALWAVLGPLLVPTAALGAITAGAWQLADWAGWVMLGLSLLWLDGTAGQDAGRARR